MRVQEGSSLHIPIHPSTASLSGFRKPGAVFDGPTCYSVQGEDNKASPPPHLNAPPLRTTNGVTTTGLKRRRIMQEQETASPPSTSMHTFVTRTSASMLQCSITLHTTMCTRKMQEGHSHPSTGVQNKQRCDEEQNRQGEADASTRRSPPQSDQSAVHGISPGHPQTGRRSVR